MKKHLVAFLLFCCTTVLYAQTEKYPVFENCESATINDLPSCFKLEVKNLFIDEFKLPNQLTEEQFNEQIDVVFIVDNEGIFRVINVNSPYLELKHEVVRVFSTFPKIEPAKYNNKAIEMQFVYPLILPLDNTLNIEELNNEAVINPLPEKKEEKQTSINSKKPLFPEHNSELNIPFTHFYYNQLESELIHHNNTHTAVKPFIYNEVGGYINLDETKNKLLKPKKRGLAVSFGMNIWLL